MVVTLLDFLCVASIVGIYPRFIEPRIAQVIKHQYPTKHQSLDGLKILQLSDLHIGKPSNPSFFNKVLKKVADLKPDLILLTGDFIQNARVDNPTLLTHFLKNLKAQHGVYAVLGNHDYTHYLGGLPKVYSPWKKLLYRLAGKTKVPKGGFSTTGPAPHPELLDLLQQCGVRLLRNEAVQPLPNLTLTGVGEYWAMDCDARALPDTEDFSLLLLHNPDGYKLFKQPDLTLSGHLHSGQVNLPFLRPLFLLTEDNYVAGFYDKLYINRGLSGVLPLRLNALPEITLIELKHA